LKTSNCDFENLFIVIYKLIATIIFFIHCFIIIMWSYNFSFLLSFNISFRTIRIEYPMIIDWISTGFSSWVLLISSVVFWYRKNYIGDTFLNKRFIILVFSFIFSMLILIISPSLLGLILGWDGLGITSFLLVIFYQNNNRLKSGLVTIYINRFGDVIIIFSIVISYSLIINSNYLNFSSSIMISMIIMLAAITKRAQIPFSAWLPIAIAAPTPVSSLVHSSTLVTAGVYLILRFYFFLKFILVRNILISISIITRITSGIIACIESDFKKVIAISTLSQLGLIIFILSLNEIKISFFHIVSHALFKSLLFLSCGIIIIISLGIQDRRIKGGIFSKFYFIPIIFVLSRLRLRGFPFLTGFFSKDFILERRYNINNNLWNYLLLIIACIITSVYRFRLIYISIKVTRSNEKIFNILENKSFFLIIILFIWSILLGKFISNFIMYSQIRIVLNTLKKLSLIILSIGLLLSNFKYWKKIIKLKNILGEIIFLNLLSSNYFSKINFFSKNVFDSKWLELGPLGRFDLSKEYNNKIKLKKRINFKYFIMIIIYFFIIF